MEALTVLYYLFVVICWLAGAGFTAYKTFEFNSYGFSYGKRLVGSAAILILFALIPLFPLFPLLFWFMSEGQKAEKAQQDRNKKMGQWAPPNPNTRAQDPMPNPNQQNPNQQFPAPQWTPQQLGLFSEWADAQAYMNIWTPQQLFWFQAWSHLFLTNNQAFQRSVNKFQSTDPIVYGQVLEFVKPTLSAPSSPQWGPGASIPVTSPAPTAQQQTQSAPAAPAPANPAQQQTAPVNVTKVQQPQQANPATGPFTAPN